MADVAEFFGRVLVRDEPPEKVAGDVVAYRRKYQTLYYCFENGLPPE